MARILNGTNQGLQNTSATYSYPLVVSMWAKAEDITAAHPIFSQSDGTDDYIGLVFAGNFTGDPLHIHSRDGGTTVFAETSSGFSANTWHHCCGAWASTSKREVWLDGTGYASNGTTSAPTFNRTEIGFRDLSTFPAWLDGSVAEAAVYDASVWSGATDADKVDNLIAAYLASLAAGVSPLMCPLGLVAYWPIMGRLSPEPDWVASKNMTLVGTPTVTDHPPGIIYPGGGFAVPAAAAAPPAGGALKSLTLTGVG